jgi:hypothetical protein
VKRNPQIVRDKPDVFVPEEKLEECRTFSLVDIDIYNGQRSKSRNLVIRKLHKQYFKIRAWKLEKQVIITFNARYEMCAKEMHNTF